MNARRWREAADALERVAPQEFHDQMRRTLCVNLASLQVHRTEIYDLLMHVTAGTRFSVGRSAAGPPTVIQKHPNGASTLLSASNDPLGALKSVLTQLVDIQRAGQPIALCGFGDGYLLDALAKHPPQLLLDRQQAIFVFEPDPEAVLATMMVHDFSGATGPIEQERFQWFIGDSWFATFRAAMFGNLQLPFPLVNICLCPAGKSIETEIRKVLADQLALDKRIATELAEFYGNNSPANRAAAFGANPPRRPRVLLITTRFSTVLQFSTRDTAEAFEQIGWDARVMIERRPHMGVTNLTLRQEILDFKPDLVFQIDHLRAEYQGVFPPELPFVCWIQDHLPNLKNIEAGRRVTSNDFVLTDAAPVYARTFGYPARQCIALSKLTRVPLLRRAETTGDDLVFVSHASQVPARLLEEFVGRMKASPEIREVIRDCGRHMIEQSDIGVSWPTYMDVRALLRGMLNERRLAITAESFDAVTAWLCMPFNNALYRQQALRWTAQVADDLGLSLMLYGNGWENHPEFARYARGAVTYGDGLEELTRRSQINLQIVPFLALHQRLFDGLVAGGFFLVRSHPADTTCPALVDFLESRVPADAVTAEQALAALDSSDRETLERLIRAARPSIATSEDDDPVQMMRSWQQARIVVAHQPLLPRLSEVSFDNAAELRARIERFIGDPAGRQRIVAEQRAEVVNRFGYTEGMRRVVANIRDLLLDSLDAGNESAVQAIVGVAA